jgi:hypothetical protein
MKNWRVFASGAPDLARFGASRLRKRPAYLATVREDGRPRVHPVTPIITEDGLYVFMEPTSPKGEDLRIRSHYALHNGVPDNAGSGGEFQVSGIGREVRDSGTRAAVVAACPYDPADRYVLFELLIVEARGKSYGDVELPGPHRWSATVDG